MRKISNQNSSEYRQVIQYNFPELAAKKINEIFESKDILQFVINLSSIEYEVRNNLITNFDAFLIIDLPIRKYIKNELLAHTVGYLGIPNLEEFIEFENALGNNQVGKNGIERYYEEYLSGIPGELIFSGAEIKNSGIKKKLSGINNWLSKECLIPST